MLEQALFHRPQLPFLRFVYALVVFQFFYQGVWRTPNWLETLTLPGFVLGLVPAVTYALYWINQNWYKRAVFLGYLLILLAYVVHYLEVLKIGYVDMVDLPPVFEAMVIFLPGVVYLAEPVGLLVEKTVKGMPTQETIRPPLALAGAVAGLAVACIAGVAEWYFLPFLLAVVAGYSMLAERFYVTASYLSGLLAAVIVYWVYASVSEGRQITDHVFQIIWGLLVGLTLLILPAMICFCLGRFIRSMLSGIGRKTGEKPSV